MGRIWYTSYGKLYVFQEHMFDFNHGFEITLRRNFQVTLNKII